MASTNSGCIALTPSNKLLWSSATSSYTNCARPSASTRMFCFRRSRSRLASEHTQCRLLTLQVDHLECSVSWCPFYSLAIEEAGRLELGAGSGFAGNGSGGDALQCEGLVLPIQVLEVGYVDFFVHLHARCAFQISAFHPCNKQARCRQGREHKSATDIS